MKLQTLIASGLLIATLSASAFALSVSVHVTPKSLPSKKALTVATRQRDKGSIDFTIACDLDKVSGHHAGGRLRVWSDTALIVDCKVAADKHQQILTYRFTVARNSIKNSSFALTELHARPVRGQERVVGGTTWYEIRLADFVSE